MDRPSPAPAGPSQLFRLAVALAPVLLLALAAEAGCQQRSVNIQVGDQASRPLREQVGPGGGTFSVDDPSSAAFGSEGNLIGQTCVVFTQACVDATGVLALRASTTASVTTLEVVRFRLGGGPETALATLPDTTTPYGQQVVCDATSSTTSAGSTSTR